jgi:hypothetical protein
MSDLPDLEADPRVRRVRKRPIATTVRFGDADGTCSTLEGPVRYRAGDAILTGVRGEQWPVSRRAFLAEYLPIAPTTAGQDGQYVKKPSEARALRLDRALAVRVGWQNDPLQAVPGDWLLRYANGSHGVLKDDIFRETYEELP